MHPQREAKTSPQFLLNSVDRSGRQIAPAVLSAAMEIGPRAVAYAQKLIGDPALAVNYLEEAAAAVSAAIEEKKTSGSSAVRNIEAYLFRTFIRIVDNAKQREAMLEKSLEEYEWIRASFCGQHPAEMALFLNEVMATCDRMSREIVLLRLEGWSWKEIGERLGVSGHAAEARFGKALDHARKMLRIRR